MQHRYIFQVVPVIRVSYMEILFGGLLREV